MILRDYVTKEAKGILGNHLIDSYGFRIKNMIHNNSKTRKAPGGFIPLGVYKSDNVLYIHLQLPSGNADKVLYDCVLKVFTNNTIMNNDIGSLNFQYWSNSPDYNFKYAYYFNKHGLIPEELIKKVNPLAIKDKPKIQNPKGDIYEMKSLCYMYAYLVDKGINKVKTLNNLVNPMGLKTLLRNLKTTEQKLSEVEKAKKIKFEDKVTHTTERVKTAQKQRSGLIKKMNKLTPTRINNIRKDIRGSGIKKMKFK